MQVEVKIDGSCKEPRVIILTDAITEEVDALLQRLSVQTPRMLAGFRGDAVTLLQEDEILRVYASAGKVFAVTGQGEYALRLRLYEMEERLSKKSFVRISGSEIINLKKVLGFDLSLAGTIRVSLAGGSTTYVSRRYVSKIKEKLGI